MVRRLERRSQETPHFRIHYIAESFAEQNLAMIGGRLENAFGVMAGLLGVDMRGAARIDVYLSDLLEDPNHPGVMLPGGGYANPGRMEIHEVYRADAPGDGLERSLLLVLLALVTGSDRPRAPMIVDGLLAYVMQRLGAFPPDDQITPMLGAARIRRELPTVLALIAGPSQATQQVYFPAVASFTSFLIRTYGVDRFKEFVRRMEPGRPEEAARAAFGRPIAQLEKAWYKTLKVAQPGGILRFLRMSWSYLRHYPVQVTEIVIYLALSVGFGIGLSQIQRRLFDRALPGPPLPDGTPSRPGDLNALLVIMGIVVAAFFIVSLTSLREGYLTAWVSESVMRQLRIRMFALIQRLHPGFFQQMQTGDIMSRMTSDLAQIEFALTGSLAQGLRVVLTLAAAVATIFWMDWKLALIAMAGTPLFFITGKWLGPAAARASFERQQNLAEATSTLQENLGAQPVVKAFSLQERMIVNYRRNLDTLFKSSLKMTFLISIFSLSANSIASAIQLTVLGVGGWLAIRGDITIGTLLAFTALMGQIIGPLQGISSILQGLQQASGAMDRVDELLKAEPAIKDAPNARPLGRLTRAIRFENVGFSYGGDQLILRNFNLIIPAGASVALVGPSGCGKSTVLNLIMRFYDPQQGRVTFDGVDLREGQIESVRGQMGVVFQDNFLFNISIRENIRLGNLRASDAEVEAAARAAEIHDMIMGMPQGYDTVVGERGSRLSGGQRQRVAIARAILRNPSILILDEATSALDPRTEAAINETLSRLARGRTTIAVTHRLSSVVNADRIYVLDRGMLVEQGTHDELVVRGGLYARLWQEQGGFVIGAGVQYVGVEASRLQGVPIFANLDGDLLAALAQRLSVERYPAGDVIINEGDPGDKLYIIHKGQVEVLSYDPAGRQRRLNVLREGDHFGEIALLYDVPRIATVRALTPVQLYSLSKEDFNTLIAAAPGLRETLQQIMAQRDQASAKR